MLTFKSLTAKYIFISLVLLFAMGIYIYAEVLFTRHLKGAATMINFAGKERALSFRIALRLEQMVDMPPSPKRTSIVKYLRQEMDEYEEILYGLRDGSEKHGLAPVYNKESLEQLNELIKIWHEMQEPLLRELLETPDEVRVREYGLFIYSHVEKIDDFVGSLTRHYEQMIKKSGIFRLYALGFFSVIFICIALFVKHSLVRPIRRLKDMALDVAKGNFDVRVDVQSRDEVGELENTFNNMAQILDIFFSEKTKRMQELSVLNKIAGVASRTLELEDMLNETLDEILNLEDLRLVKKGAVLLCDEKKKNWKLVVCRYLSKEQTKIYATAPDEEYLCGIAAKKGEILFSESNFEDQRDMKICPEEKGLSKMILPLKLEDKILGVICLYLPSGTKRPGQEIELYKSIADIISVSVGRALTHRQVSSLASHLADAQRIALFGGWDWDLEKDKLKWSDEVYRIFGLEPEEFDLTYKTFLNLVHPDDRELVNKSINEALYGKKPYRLDHRIVRPDGSELIVHERAEVIFDRAGRPIQMSGTVQDITERKNIEEKIKRYSQELEEKVKKRTAELEKTKEAAEAANRAKSEFLANMSHELRTPLNAIIGFSEILHGGITGPVADIQKEYLHDIWESGRNLLDLINDILDLSKIEAGRTELEPNQFNLKNLIERSFVMFKEKAMKHNIKIRAEIEGEIEAIVADERKIKQIIFNLLDNAMKFTPDGGSVTVCARLVNSEKLDTDDYSLTTERNFVEISVEDTGIGISPESQKKLFQPFQQIETTLSRKYPGTGLGLSLCRKFVELHKGKIWVESEVGKGSRFILVIPLRQ